jgi:heme-degrading monooxygenase HmoA
MERAGDEQDRGAWSSRDAVEAWQWSRAARDATLAAATERMLDCKPVASRAYDKPGSPSARG